MQQTDGYLNWGTVDSDGGFNLFRRAKVMLSAFDTALVRDATRTYGELHRSIRLTDAKGNPTCARLTPQQIEWNVVQAAPSKA